MHRAIRHIDNEHGVGLVNAMLALSLLAVFALVAASLAINERRTTFNDRIHTEAFVSADSGGEESIAWLRSQTKTPIMAEGIDGDTTVASFGSRSMDMAHSDQQFEYRIAVDPKIRTRQGGPVGYSAGSASYRNMFFIVQSRGAAGTDGESKVELLVSKLIRFGYNG